MAPKRKLSQVSAPYERTPKKRTTQSGASDGDADGKSTGLNGGYWSPTSRGKPGRALTSEDHGSSKKKSGSSAALTDEDSEPELAIIPVRKRSTAKVPAHGTTLPKSSPRTVSPRKKKPLPSSSRSTARLPKPSVEELPLEEDDDELPQLPPNSSQVSLATTATDDEKEDNTLPSLPMSPSKRSRKPGPRTKASEDAQKATSPRKPGRPAAKQVVPRDEALFSTPMSLSKNVPPQDDADDAVPTTTTAPSSPRKRDGVASPSRLPCPLPSQFMAQFRAQKSAVFCALRDPTVLSSNAAVVDENASDKNLDTRALAAKQLRSLLKGTTKRGEGNSCMLIGPKSSGKTHMVEQLLSDLKPADETRPSPIVIRLSGHVQHNDRLAMREIVRQLVQQTDMASYNLPEDDDDDEGEDTPGGLIADPDENPFLDHEKEEGPSTVGTSVRLPPTAHLPSLISTLPTLGRPVIIILDAFDLFALHARQALLYCLLDTVQHSQAAMHGANYQSSSPTKGKEKAEQNTDWSGLAVVGVTVRIDTLELLEKRVKSRFSGRIMRTAAPGKWEEWAAMINNTLLALPSRAGAAEGDDSQMQWDGLWESAVDTFMSSADVKETFMESISLVKDLSLVSRILTALLLSLSPKQPWPTVYLLKRATASQRRPSPFANLSSLHYPAICLLIAATHARTAGHEQVTFEQLHNDFRDQVRKSTAAPVQMAGASIGMVRCSRSVLMGAFEQLVLTNIFVPAGASAGSASLSREFVKYRCLPEREDIKKAVDKIGQTNLKKWFGKAT